MLGVRLVVIDLLVDDANTRKTALFINILVASLRYGVAMSLKLSEFPVQPLFRIHFLMASVVPPEGP